MKARLLLTFAIATALFVPWTAMAQVPEGVHPTEILNQLIQSIPGKRIRVTRIVIEPGKDVSAHNHPGDEYGIVLEGTLMLKMGNADYIPYSADSTDNNFCVPRDTPMNVKNITDRAATMISILIIDADKPPLHYLHEWPYSASNPC